MPNQPVADLSVVIAFQLIAVALFVYSVYYVRRLRNPVYVGVLVGTTGAGLLFDWVMNCNWYFRVTYSPNLIPVFGIGGVHQPIALTLVYGAFFGLTGVALTERRAWLDRRLGKAGYLLVFLAIGLLQPAFEIPTANYLHVWTYWQRPEFLILGVPWSSAWLSGLLGLGGYVATRLVIRWQGQEAALVGDGCVGAGAGSRERRWKYIALGAAGVWAAYYCAISLHLFWYAAAQPWVESPRPF